MGGSDAIKPSASTKRCFLDVKHTPQGQLEMHPTSVQLYLSQRLFQ